MVLVVGVVTYFYFDMPLWWWSLAAGLQISQMGYLAHKRWPYVLLWREYERLVIDRADLARRLEEHDEKVGQYSPVNSFDF